MKLLFVTIIFAFAGSACMGADCAIDGDCDNGDTCIAGACTTSRQPMAEAPDLGTSTDGEDVSVERDASREPEQEIVAPTPEPDVDEPPADMGAAVTTPEMSTSDGPACTIDPFTFTCMDDAFEPNNIRFDGARLFDQTMGCPVADFVGRDASYVSTMCPLDGEDWYYFNLFPCDTRPFVVEWQVQLESDCDPSVLHLEPYGIDCSDDLVDCSPVDGKPTVRFIVSPSVQDFRSSYVKVSHGGAGDVTFNYRIHVSIRE